MSQHTITDPSLAEMDRAHVLHPFTSVTEHQDAGPQFIDRAEGTRVYDREGKEYLDTMAGLWCVNVGYGHPRMVEAIRKQAEELSFYHSFMGSANEPATRFAEAIAQRAPGGLNRVFFCNSGSEANDTHVKLIWLYNNLRGKPEKKKIIARDGGFHGTTGFAASMCGLPHMHAHFDLPLDRFIHVRRPHYYFDAAPGQTEREFSQDLARDLDERIQREGADTVAAFIAEPVMGASGVVPAPEGYFEAIVPVLREHDILFIADEVISGFGRLGAMFGSDIFNLEPDMMTLAKGMTSGYVPMSAAVISDAMWEVLREASGQYGLLAHGHTYTGHPIAATAGLTSLAITEDEGLIEQAARVGAHLHARLAEACALHPLVGEIRGLGMIAGIELVADKEQRTPFDPKLTIARKLHNRLLEEGVIARPIMNTLVMAPPLVMTEADADFAVDRIALCLDRLADDLRTEGIWKG